MKLTGADVRRQEFPTSFRGYNPLDVQAFLHFVADTVDELTRRNEELSENVARLSEQLQGSGEREERLQRALEAVSQMRQEVSDRAKALMSRAEADAARMTTEAREESRRLLEGSERDLRRLREEITDLEFLRDRILRDLSEMLRSQARLIERETERLGVDLLPSGEEESSKIISLNPKAEGERS